MGVVCPSCGYDNPRAARFCSSCGLQLESSGVRDQPTAVLDALVGIDFEQFEEPPVSPGELPAGSTAVLMVRQGPKKGSRISLDTDQVTIGRHPESDIFLDDVTVSRRHAELRRVGDTYHVSDVGSLNGTYVNQERVEQQILRDGDELQVGKFKLVYVALAVRG